VTGIADFVYLPDTALEALDISPADMADAIEAAIAEKAAGRLHVAPKSAVLPGVGRYMMSTLAVGDAAALTVLKAVTVSPENPGLGLPAINGAILALDAQTGLLRAVMGANWVTAARTAGLSHVAARRLADPGSETIGFIGCGVQAQSHLRAFAGAFPIRRIRAFGRGAANRDALLEAARAMGLAAEAAASPDAALDGADIVVSSVTLDYSITPFLDAGLLKPGAFAAITDLAIPWLPETLGAFDTIVIDDREQEAASERKMVPPDRIAADLTELATGAAPLAFDPARRTAFAFRGIALGDFAAAALALDRAVPGG